MNNGNTGDGWNKWQNFLALKVTCPLNGAILERGSTLMFDFNENAELYFETNSVTCKLMKVNFYIFCHNQ